MENKVYIIAEVTNVPEVEYRDYLNPMKARRYGRLLRRALVKDIKESGVDQPDAIINGTAMGCIENTERMLDALATEGEQMSMPTNFMQSTHNTIASLIAIHMGNHGYNSTYAHGRISFESALLDAFLQIKSGRIRTALVCANDEITPALQAKLQAAGTVCVAEDRSVAIVLSSEKSVGACKELVDIRLRHHPQNDDTAEIITRELCD